MASDLTPEIVRVRPGRSAQEWVRRTVAELKGDDPLAPVTLIVPNYYAGRQARWLLARSGGYVNVRSLLLGDVASNIAPLRGTLPLTPVLEESAVRAAIDKVGGVLRPLAHHRSLHETLLQLFRELRRRETPVLEPPNEMARAALATFAAFQTIIEPFTDRTRVRERATLRLRSAGEFPCEVRELGAFIVLLPPRLDPVDARLLAALALWAPLRAGFARFEAADGLANAPGEEGVAELESALRALSIQWDAVDVKSASQPPVLKVVRAPDPAEEIREVIRWITRDIEASTPLHQIAVLYRQTDPYGALVRDSLMLAGVPWSALEGRTLAESGPGRALLTLLQVPQRDFAREALLGWIDAAPREQAGLPGSAWDRMSRAANVVRGSVQWLVRLGNFVARQRELAEQRAAEGNTPAANALRYEADLAERMRAALVTLEQALHPPRDESSWGDFVAWAETLWSDQCGGVRVWPEDERPFAQDVASTLAGLRDADILEARSGPSLNLFLITLQDALEGRARPVGSLGKGVLVGPIQSVTGLTFEHIYIVGMTEGAFPTPPPTDPFFPPAEEDPLASRERQRGAERLAFRTAIAAADGGLLTLSAPDSISGRKAFPSPWLLELATSPSGESLLLTSTFQAMRQTPERPWLRVVASAIDGLKAAPMLSDLEESRLREASGVDRLDLQPIAARHDLPLGAGLSASNARATSDFTEFDGNLFSAVDSPSELHRVLESVQRISASGIETWATCPFQFFLGRVLRVTSTDRPEDGWTVDPLERGSLIHDILEQFFKELQRRDRLDHLDDYTPADYHLLDTLADECFAELERRGVTGHPLVWENTSAAIRADLRTFLVKDERWRREEGWRPRYFEQAFGIDDPASWAPLELEFAGTHVRFRGYIDRVDVHRSGRRAFLYDYKTGGRTSYAGMENDPVLAGKHVQLALYRRAVLASIPDLEDVDGAYWFVSSRGEFKMLSLTVSQLNADQRLADVLEGTARGILAGAFPQVPGNETVRPGKFSWDNCAYCAFDRICPAGRDAVFERKQAAPGYTLHASLAAASTHASDA